MSYLLFVYKTMLIKLLIKGLCDILMTIGIPAEILTETVNTVAEVIRGNQVNQSDFSTVNAPYTPPRWVIFVGLLLKLFQGLKW